MKEIVSLNWLRIDVMQVSCYSDFRFRIILSRHASFRRVSRYSHAKSPRFSPVQRRAHITTRITSTACKPLLAFLPFPLITAVLKPFLRCKRCRHDDVMMGAGGANLNYLLIRDCIPLKTCQ